MADDTDDEVAFWGAARAARELAAGEISAPDLLEVHLARIARLDPELNAFRVVPADEARAEAAAAQQRLDAGERQALLGVPIAVKDDIDVAGQVTAWGTAAHGPPTDADGEVVRRLREAGAVVIGKTAVPEMTIWPFTETVTYGATRNPWDPSRTPGGSSGGTAVAVATGMAPIGIGSDGAGSIRIPSSWCGLYGLKPQRGRVSIAPHDDAWQGLSVNGPIARFVEDAALFLDATTTTPGPEGGFVAAAAREPGRLRVAVTTRLPPGVVARVGRDQLRAVAETADLLRRLGHQVVERDLDVPPTAMGSNTVVRYLRGVADDVATMPHPERLEARTRGMARLGARLPERVVRAARDGEAAITERITRVFDDVDVVLLPSNATGPSRIGQYQRRGAIATVAAVSARVPFHGLANVTGLPAAAVPWGLDGDGLPLGIQLLGRPDDEATLLALSTQLETAQPWSDRRPPPSRARGPRPAW